MPPRLRWFRANRALELAIDLPNGVFFLSLRSLCSSLFSVGCVGVIFRHRHLLFPHGGNFRTWRQSLGKGGGITFSLQPPLNHDRAQLIVMVKHLTMQTLDALIGIDVPFGMNGLHRAFIPTALTGVAAFAIAAQPVEYAQPRGYGERCTKRTEIATEETFNGKVRREQCQRVKHEWPSARKTQYDCRLERLDFGGSFGKRK